MYKPSGLRSPAVRSDYGCCPYRRERWELNNGGGRVLGPFRVGIRCTYVCTTSLFAQTVFQYMHQNDINMFLKGSEYEIEGKTKEPLTNMY